MLVYQRVRVVILNWPEKSSQHEHHDIGSQNATAVAHSYHDPTCLLCVGPFFSRGQQNIHRLYKHVSLISVIHHLQYRGEV